MSVKFQKPQQAGLTRSLSRRNSFGAAEVRDDRGWTPLHVASRMGDLDEVRLFPPDTFRIRWQGKASFSASCLM